MLSEKLISIKDNKATFVMDLKLSDNITKTKDGYLLCKNSFFGRTGFQTYLGRELVNMGFGDDELVDVFRDEQDVFNEDSLETFVGKPVTLGHPNVDVTIDNIGKLGKGTIIGKPKRVDDNVVGDIIITDKETIELVENKKIRELSLGYQTKLVRDGDRVKQTEIYINHLALVERGRAGTAMIVDEEVQVMDKEKLLETLANSNAKTINIYFGDEKKEEVKDETLENVEQNKDETLEEKDEAIEEGTNDKKEEVKDEELENKEKEKEKETMTKDELKALLSEFTLEDKKELLGLNDEKQEVENNVNDEMFTKVEKVENIVDGKVELNDYSSFTTDGVIKALQEEVDRFSFRNLNMGTNNLNERQNKLNDLKTRDGRDFIKGGY